jgi:SSS family solute:Na+ symporter
MFWLRMNEQGAYAGFFFGFIFGISRLISGYVYLRDENPPGFVSLNFLYFGLVLFIGCCFVIIVVSLFFPAPNQFQLSGEC